MHFLSTYPRITRETNRKYVSDLRDPDTLHFRSCSSITFPKKRPRTVKAVRGPLSIISSIISLKAPRVWVMTWEKKKDWRGFKRNLILDLPIVFRLYPWNEANQCFKIVCIISFTGVGCLSNLVVYLEVYILQTFHCCYSKWCDVMWIYVVKLRAW